MAWKPVSRGGTSTGKTTFMGAVLKEIPPTERIITVEDAREVNIDHIPNRVHLLSSKGSQGRAQVTTQTLIEACLRLRPEVLDLAVADRQWLLLRSGRSGIRLRRAERIGKLAERLLHAGAGAEQRRAENEADRRPPCRA